MATPTNPWRRAAGNSASRTRPCQEARGNDANPYRGLAPITVDDAERFFGRDSLTEHLLAATGERVGSSGLGPVVVVGASGSGKTSVLRAGLKAQFAARESATSPGRWHRCENCSCSPRITVVPRPVGARR